MDNKFFICEIFGNLGHGGDTNLLSSAAEFRKYCKRLHIDLYKKRKRLHTKYSIVHLPFDNVWCLTAMEMSDNSII